MLLFSQDSRALAGQHRRPETRDDTIACSRLRQPRPALYYKCLTFFRRWQDGKLQLEVVWLFQVFLPWGVNHDWLVKTTPNREENAEDRTTGTRGTRRSRSAFNLQGQYNVGHGGSQPQDGEGRDRSYLVAFGYSGRQREAEFRHDHRPKGTFTLTIPGANEDADATGDLDIKGNVTIKGKNASSTIIDGNNLDRVIQVLSGKVQISGVTIQHGRSNEGGGLLNSGGKVTLTSVIIANNVAAGTTGANGVIGAGGGTVGGVGSNGSSGGSTFGGGIANQTGSLIISKSTISSNQAIGGNGGQGGGGGFGQGTGNVVGTDGQSGTGGAGGAGGSAGSAFGGGVFIAAGTTLSISDTAFSSNVAIGGTGGQGGFGGFGFGGRGGDSVSASVVGGGGDGKGGNGGNGGAAGTGEGGGIFNLGSVTVTDSWVGLGG